MGRTAISSGDRLSLRVPEEKKRRIEAAAQVNGQSVTDFVLGAADDRARQVLQEHTVYTLPSAVFDAMVATLDDPPEPTQALVDLLREG